MSKFRKRLTLTKEWFFVIMGKIRTKGRAAINELWKEGSH